MKISARTGSVIIAAQNATAQHPGDRRGPVGLSLRWPARASATATLLEAQERIDDSPRASTTQPPTLEILAELGLIDEYIAQASWRARSQSGPADAPADREFDFGRLRDETPIPGGADRAAQARQHGDQATALHAER